MKQLILTIIASSLICLSALAQRAQVKGKVTDTSGNPVIDLTIYIPFTSKHTITNAQGEYLLKDLQAGEIELVYRHIAFKSFSKILNIDSNSSIDLNVEVDDNVVEMQEIIKRADQADWKFGWEKFQEYVLGDSLGRFCSVKNPSDLYFYYDGEKLRGYAMKPIEILNNYLGYRMIYYLDYFWFQEGKLLPDDVQRNKTFAFSGSAFYIDRMEDNWMRRLTWKRNRATQYRGTLRHFLHSVYYGQLADQGYLVREAWTDVSDLQKSENVSPSVAYVRFQQMRKVYFWDSEAKMSSYLHFSPDQDYPILSDVIDLNQIQSRKQIAVKNELLVFYFYNSTDRMEDARIMYFKVKSNKSDNPAELLIDDLGNFVVEEGRLIWSFLDIQTNLSTALPGDFIPAIYPFCERQ